jgi:hypothetical protein
MMTLRCAPDAPQSIDRCQDEPESCPGRAATNVWSDQGQEINRRRMGRTAMKKVGRLLLLGLGVVTLATLAAHFNSGTTRAVDLDHVKVVDSASDPRPLPEV